MRFLRGLIVFLALALCLFMTFDGSRALIAGDYLTPTSGPYAGQLGPWSRVVSAIGIEPRSTLMKMIFVVFGIAWLLAIVAFLRRAGRSVAILCTLAVLTLWYLPVGTVVAIALLIALAVHQRSPRMAS